MVGSYPVPILYGSCGKKSAGEVRVMVSVFDQAPPSWGNIDQAARQAIRSFPSCLLFLPPIKMRLSFLILTPSF